MVEPIVVFSGSHRLACEQVKELLSRAGRVFTVRNVDEDDDAYRELMALNLRSVPMTVVGAGRRIVGGLEPAALTSALAGNDSA